MSVNVTGWICLSVFRSNIDMTLNCRLLIKRETVMLGCIKYIKLHLVE